MKYHDMLKSVPKVNISPDLFGLSTSRTGSVLSGIISANAVILYGV